MQELINTLKLAITTELQNDVSSEAVKDFSLTMGTLFTTIGIVIGFKNNFSSASAWLVLGASIMLLTLLSINLVKPIYKYWMIFSQSLGVVMSYVILSVIYYLILTPSGYLSKVTKKEFFKFKLEPSAKTYWIKKKKTLKDKKSYEQQY